MRRVWRGGLGGKRVEGVEGLGSFLASTVLGVASFFTERGAPIVMRMAWSTALLVFHNFHICCLILLFKSPLESYIFHTLSLSTINPSTQ